MQRRFFLLSLTLAALLFVGTAVQPATAQNLQAEPPGGAYQKVSNLVELPDFVPGLGVLYVQPETLPAGPFLAYDRDGSLVSTVYMVPLESLSNKKAFTNLSVAHQEVDHVDFKYNPGHPGLDQPHYHVILWHVSPEEAANLGS